MKGLAAAAPRRPSRFVFFFAGTSQTTAAAGASVEVWRASTGLMCSSSFLRCEMRQEEGWREGEGGAKPPD